MKGVTKSMKSIRSLFKIGNGPSSSHTMGPKKATEYILKKYPNSDMIFIELCGSLAATGIGHLTQYIIEKTLKGKNYSISYVKEEKSHPNTMIFHIYSNNQCIGEEEIYSIGGGTIWVKGEKEVEEKELYPERNFEEILNKCQQEKWDLVQYVLHYEGETIFEYMEECYAVMMHNIQVGLEKEGLLPGELRVSRKARTIYLNQKENEKQEHKEKRLVSAYAFAASEENASGAIVVTAPTCGASGVLPALIRYLEEQGFEHEQILKGMLVAGLIGSLIKQNASISGAECGCQAEIGTACSMGAAFVSYVYHQDIHKIEHAAEIALEHHLGLTCDPIKGYVQIPCIERNAVAALRSIEVAVLSELLNSESQKISLDTVVETMLETGRDLLKSYRETAEGGLAKNYHEC